jgi:AcrR family transcriptional regulator
LDKTGTKHAEKRTEIVATLASHFLEAGLGDIGLRRLAEVAGTSDRMLLYYFENKDELVTAVLSEIGRGLAETLGEIVGPTPLAPHRALALLWRTLKRDAFANQLRIWLDLSSQASRGDPLFGAIVSQMAAGWIAWLAAMLDVPKADKAPLAILMMGAVDGQLVLFPTDLSKGDAAIARLGKMLAGRR